MSRTIRTLSHSLPLVAILLVGCQPSERIQTQADPRRDAEERTSLRTRLPIFDGQGQRVSWQHVLNAADDVNVVIIGEQHDDATGHAVQQAFVEDGAERWPSLALSLEMLDRRRQSAADDYVAGIIDRDQFLHDIASTKFRSLSRKFLDGDIKRADFERRIFAVGWPDWMNNYQPTIDVAREHEMPIIAANTPWRRYQSLANKEGFERLDALTPAQRELVEVPGFLPDDGYRTRFFAIMSPSSHGATDNKGEANPHTDGHSKIIEGAYRAQCVMDATMADSIADALDARADRVIHLVGQFHSDFQGGTVQQLLHLRPQTRVMTISLQAADAEALREADRDRADYVIYTGGAE